MLAYALGRVLDREKQPAPAFQYFRSANALQREQSRARGAAYDRHRSVDQFAAVKMRYGHISATAPQPSPGQCTPVFILGMPRSGTTLMDRILSSLPGVASTGENQAMARIQHELDAMLTYDSDTGVQGILEHHGQRFTAQYYQSLTRIAGAARAYTDKAPMNFLNIGLIRVLLPEAKVIHMRRDPMNVCLSMFMRNFNEAFPCASDLSDLGHYYRLYEDLMQFWREVLPGWVLDVDYQSLVEDTEATARRVTDFCSLEWNPACLEFHQNTQAAFTFSELQVRKPIYRSSLEKWRAYEEMLAPLRQSLADNSQPRSVPS
jgi:Sulfotransferase family